MARGTSSLPGAEREDSNRPYAKPPRYGRIRACVPKTPCQAEKEGRRGAGGSPPATAAEGGARSALSDSDSDGEEVGLSEASSEEQSEEMDADMEMDEDMETDKMAPGCPSKRQNQRQLVVAARKRVRQATTPAHARNMWQALEGRKWRPPAAMYPSPLHTALREFARQELSETANFQSLHVRADLSEEKKVLPSDGEARVQKRVAVLMVAEIIPPAAISAMCAQPLEELTPERVTFAIQTSMGNLSPDGTIKAVYGFLKFWDWLRKTGRSFDRISHLDVSEYLSVVHGEATQGSSGSARPGSEVLIDADGSDNDVLQEDADEQDQLLETIDDVWQGYSAASGQRSLLVRLEKNFHFPMGAIESKVPQVGQGARLTAPRRHATAPSPLTFRAVQTYVERDDTGPIMATIGSSFMLSGVSTKCATQLQTISFYAENETVAAVRVPKKDASGKGRYEDILVYKPGVGRSDKWWKKHQKILHDVRKGKFSYRDYYFVDLDGKRHQCKDPRKANRQANCAMPAWDRPIVRCLHGRLPMLFDTCCKKLQVCRRRKFVASPNTRAVPSSPPAAKCVASRSPGSSSWVHGLEAVSLWMACRRMKFCLASSRWYRHARPAAIVAPAPRRGFSRLSKRIVRPCTS